MKIRPTQLRILYYANANGVISFGLVPPYTTLDNVELPKGFEFNPDSFHIGTLEQYLNAVSIFRINPTFVGYNFYKEE